MRFKSLILLLLLACSLSAVETVRLESLSTSDWQRLKGQRIRINGPLYVIGSGYNEIMLSPERLYVPEEHATGLADGDSTTYFALKEKNARLALHVNAPYEWQTLMFGAVVNGFEGRVDSAHYLSSGAYVKYRNPRPASVPNMGRPDVLVCGANIQNFFVHLGGYASKKTTPYQFEMQRLKIASALVKMNADIYALCELEKGESAPAALCEAMNRLSSQGRYSFVRTGATDGDTISCGYIYRQDKIAPYGPCYLAYKDTTNIYAYRFLLQGFRSVDTGEKFVISLNHLRSKRVPEGLTPADVHLRRMNNVDSILTALREVLDENIYDDADILMLGDYNCYTQEAPIQTIVRAGYQDLLMQHDSLGYSYVYRGEMGYLDRAFASPTMAEQVVAVHPVHWNADYAYAYGYSTKYLYPKRVIPKQLAGEPTKSAILSKANKTAKKHLIHRYADHDPLLIGLRLGTKK